jgi:hypothetical protein
VFNATFNNIFVISWRSVLLMEKTGVRGEDNRLGSEHRLGQTKDYKIDTCCFSAKHGALIRRNKDWLARNQDNIMCPNGATCLSADCCFSELIR